jgi:hypothetical protein
MGGSVSVTARFLVAGAAARKCRRKTRPSDLARPAFDRRRTTLRLDQEKTNPASPRSRKTTVFDGDLARIQSIHTQFIRARVFIRWARFGRGNGRHSPDAGLLIGPKTTDVPRYPSRTVCTGNGLPLTFSPRQLSLLAVRAGCDKGRANFPYPWRHSRACEMQ